MGLQGRQRDLLRVYGVGTLAEILTARGEGLNRVQWLRWLDSTGKVHSLTYGELLQNSRRVAGALDRVEKSETVLLILPTSFDFLFVFWGVILKGAVPVPIYPPVNPDRLDQYAHQLKSIIENCNAGTIIASRSLLPLIRLMIRGPTSFPPISTVDQLLVHQHPLSRLPAVSPQDTALIQYTSGSTGAPKGVELSHRNILANIQAIEETFQYTDKDVGVSWLPLYHDMGLIGALIGTLYSAVPLVLMSPLDFIRHPKRWLWAIHTYRGTVSAAPNFAYSLCARKVKDHELTGLRLDSWRVALSGAEPVLPETLQRFFRRFAPYGFRESAFLPAYGLAESCLAVTFSKVGGGPEIRHYDRKIFETEGRAVSIGANKGMSIPWVSAGTPLTGQRVRIVDEDRKEMPERTVGEVQVQGPSVMKGYYRRPEATAEILKDRWLCTGDLGFLDGGQLFVTGRKRELIIKEGRNYYPQDLETAAGQVEGVRQGCVSAFGVPNPLHGTEDLVVVAETRVRFPGKKRRIRQEIRREIYQAVGCNPDQVVLVPPGWVSKTTSGKLQRSLCRQRYLEGKLGGSKGWPLWRLLQFYLKSTLTKSD